MSSLFSFFVSVTKMLNSKRQLTVLRLAEEFLVLLAQLMAP